MMSSGDTQPRGRGSSRGERPAPGGTLAPTFEEMVGRSSMHETGLAGIADILDTTRSGEHISHRACEHKPDNEWVIPWIQGRGGRTSSRALSNPGLP